MAYDVIIAGGSFAGLAVASQLRGKILLIEPNGLGEHQTSACGTPLGVPERLGLMDTVLQVHRELVLHTPTYTAVVNVSDNPFCTFDYKKFCEGMAAAMQADILKAQVLGVAGREVVTNRGRFAGQILVDASGWRAALGSCKRQLGRRRRFMNFGIETVTARRGEKLCFWFSPEVDSHGIAWFFPVGNGSRVGVATYTEDNRLGSKLEAFLESLGLARAGIHGGYFPAALFAPVKGNLFLVGDAAGQCLPLTGEGIRPAIYFGQACGSIIQGVLGGRMSLEEAIVTYRRFVMQHQKIYRLFRIAQIMVATLPQALARSMFLLACKEISLSYLLPRYLGFADPEHLRPLVHESFGGDENGFDRGLQAEAA